jgi:hypothetical protein
MISIIKKLFTKIELQMNNTNYNSEETEFLARCASTKITDESLAGSSLLSKPDYSTKLLNSSYIINGLPPGLTCFPENRL